MRSLLRRVFLSALPGKSVCDPGVNRNYIFFDLISKSKLSFSNSCGPIVRLRVRVSRHCDFNHLSD